MTNDNQLTIVSHFATTGTSLNLIHCIEQFDNGRNNVYIIDENGDYTGFAVTKNSFRKIWNSIDNSIVSVPSIDDSINNQQKLQQVIKILNNDPTLNEVPLIENKRISSVIINKFPTKPQGFLWNAFSTTNFSPDILKYNRI